MLCYATLHHYISIVITITIIVNVGITVTIIITTDSNYCACIYHHVNATTTLNNTNAN